MPSIMSVAFANLGVLSARFGDLPEAEAYFKRGITLVEQVNDPVYVSLWQSCQAHILQDQGKMNEAKAIFAPGTDHQSSDELHSLYWCSPSCLGTIAYCSGSPS